MPTVRKVIVRGLARFAGWMFAVWGTLVFLKGLWDCFFGRPDANDYSLRPWDFVTREQWSRYAGFELCYGLACVALAWALWRFAPRLPEYVEKDFSSGKIL